MRRRRTGPDDMQPVHGRHREGAPPLGTAAMALVTIAAALASISTVGLIRWNIGLSSNQNYVSTVAFDLWVLLLSIESALWVLIAFGLWRHLALVLQYFPALHVDRVQRVRAGSDYLIAIAVGVVALATPLMIGSALGLDSKAPLWGHYWKSNVLTTIAVVAALPGAVAVTVIRDIADNLPFASGDRAGELGLVCFLRRQHRSIVGLLSFEITMLVIVNSGLRQALLAADPPIETLPARLVIAYAAAFTFLVVGVHLYGNLAIDRRATLLLDDWTPLPDGAGPDPKSRIDQRSAMSGVLGVESSVRESVGGIVVMGLPLISGLVTGTIDAAA